MTATIVFFLTTDNALLKDKKELEAIFNIKIREPNIVKMKTAIYAWSALCLALYKTLEIFFYLAISPIIFVGLFFLLFIIEGEISREILKEY